MKLFLIFFVQHHSFLYFCDLNEQQKLITYKYEIFIIKHRSK